MANNELAYLYNDWVKDLAAGNITITNEDSNYPTENLQDEEVAETCRTTAKVAIKLQFDMGASVQPKIFAILNHNFSGGTFDINSYTANDFSTGKVTVESAAAIRLLDTYHLEANAPTAQQYWEIDLTNATSADSYFEIGRVMIYSDVVTLNEIEHYKKNVSINYKNIINQTEYGIRYAHKLLANEINTFDLTWKNRTSNEVKTLFKTVFGSAYNFLWIGDKSAVDCYYVHIASDSLQWVDVFRETYIEDIGITLIECARGKS